MNSSKHDMSTRETISSVKGKNTRVDEFSYIIYPICILEEKHA